MQLRNGLNAFYYSSALCELRLMNSRSGEEALSYNSLLYLELIFSMDGSCTVSGLAELLYISKAAVSLKVNELIKKGLIIKTPNPSDRRQSFLRVNEQALPRFTLYRSQDDEAERQIKKEFSPEDIKKFCRMLDILSQINLKEIRQEKSINAG